MYTTKECGLLHGLPVLFTFSSISTMFSLLSSLYVLSVYFGLTLWRSWRRALGKSNYSLGTHLQAEWRERGRGQNILGKQATMTPRRTEDSALCKQRDQCASNASLKRARRANEVCRTGHLIELTDSIRYPCRELCHVLLRPQRRF